MARVVDDRGVFIYYLIILIVSLRQNSFIGKVFAGLEETLTYLTGPDSIRAVFLESIHTPVMAFRPLKEILR